MSNVDRVGPTNPASSARASAASPKNFQETMQQVEKVQEVDPDEASRRQRASDVDSLLQAKKNMQEGSAPTGASLPVGLPPSPFSVSTVDKSEEVDSDLRGEPEEEPPHKHEPIQKRTDEKKRKKAFRPIEEKSKDKKQKHEQRNLTASLATPFVEAEAFAIQATKRLAPYVSKELLVLFQKMVGTLMGMVSSSGILHIEIVLDQPGFEHSIFYGSTLIIDRYASAANAMNIILTGPNAAVEIFRNNLPSLTEAFKRGRFPFRIGRMEAHYRETIQPKKEAGEDTE